jgi:hypothetical protein
MRELCACHAEPRMTGERSAESASQPPTTARFRARRRGRRAPAATGSDTNPSLRRPARRAAAALELPMWIGNICSGFG